MPNSSTLRVIIAVMLLLMGFIYNECLCEENPLFFSTRDCYLTEPVYGHKFDFTSLRSDLEHIVISDKGDTFAYNICGNIGKTCNGQSSVAACLRRGSEEIVLGTKHQLNYHNGKIYFSFMNGTTCPSGTGEYQLHVFIGCDYTVDQKQSHVTSYADDTCSFYITLETPHACLPEHTDFKTSNCSVRDPHTGHTYDLLSLSDVNYRLSDRNGSAFVINVCKPVLYGENAMCPAGSSICFVALNSSDYKQKYFDYGISQANPIIENSQLLLRHNSSTPCNTDANYTSIIYFYCDMDVKNGHPELIGFHGCVYEFSFVTPLACNNLAPCSAITHGNEIIDMSSLKDKPFTLQMNNSTYTFAVCSYAGSPCLENAGACLSLNGQSTSLGTANSHLLFNKTGSPYLLYEGGAKCLKSNAVEDSEAATMVTAFWSTKIEFVCGDTTTKDNATGNSDGRGAGGTGGGGGLIVSPKIIENSNCQLLIHYQTNIACQEQIACKAKVYITHTGDAGTGEDFVDLTPLISANENYEAKINLLPAMKQQFDKSTRFYLNVCRPLVSKYGLGCPGGSAACMAKMTSSSNTPEEEQSLGYPLTSLVAINRTTAELRYIQGGTCQSDNNTQLSSSIVFFCDMRAGRGIPVLYRISDCHYQFKWGTNVICPPHMCSFNDDTCEIMNDEINIHYNLRKAPFADEGKLKIDIGKNKFTMDICGKHHKAVTDYSQGLVNIFFTTKGPCGPDEFVNVQMRLICSSEAKGATTFSDDTQCNILYVQRTPDICKFLGLEVPTTNTTPSSTGATKALPTSTAETTTKLQDGANNNDVHRPSDSTDSTTEKENSSSLHPVEREGLLGYVLGIVLTLGFIAACVGAVTYSQERGNWLRRLWRQRISAVRYSRVHSNEEANLLLETNGEFTDSDDDMLL